MENYTTLTSTQKNTRFAILISDMSMLDKVLPKIQPKIKNFSSQ